MSYVCQRAGLNPSMGATLDVLSQVGQPWAGSSTARPMVPLQDAAEKAGHPLSAVENESKSHPPHLSDSKHLGDHDSEGHYLKVKTPEEVGAETAAFQNGNWKEIRSVVPQGVCGTALAERYPMDRRGYVSYAAHYSTPASNQCHATKAEASYWHPKSWKVEGAPQYLPGYSGFLRGPFGGANL